MSIKRNPFPKCPKLEYDESMMTEPESWTIITALNRVLTLAEDSELSDEFWNLCKNPLAFLNKELGLTNVQIVALAIMIESGDGISWKGYANYLGCSRLSVMIYSDEIEQLVTKRWAVHKAVHEIGERCQGFGLADGVVKALRQNKPFVPEKIDGLTEQQFVDKLESHIDKNLGSRTAMFEDDEVWMQQLVKANPHLPLCHEVLCFDDIHVQSLLLMIVFDYAQWADSDEEGLTLHVINDLYPEDYDCDYMRCRLRDGSHPLIRRGYIEFRCDDGVVNNEQYRLTRKAKQHLLSAYVPSKSKCPRRSSDNRFLKSHSAIKEKPLFYNSSEQQQIQRLTSLLSQQNLPSVQQRLEEQGMRKGFACLFYGAPGTGKTETVLQIARQTGRDLMPILLFNEADAIINKRTENVAHSVDKMDNAMQNIILQELEDLEGILIATTNLTSNLDRAFERRFLFKVEFKKPTTDVKAQIWKAMLKDITPEDARQLASHFDFSGGQIENIARKRTIDYILSGKFASFDEIEGYCRAEQLNGKEHRAIGFTR